MDSEVEQSIASGRLSSRHSISSPPSAPPSPPEDEPNDNATLLQNAWRTHKSLMHIRQLRSALQQQRDETSAATKLQGRIRMARARRTFAEVAVEARRQQAATTVQRTWLYQRIARSAVIYRQSV